MIRSLLIYFSVITIIILCFFCADINAFDENIPKLILLIAFLFLFMFFVYQEKIYYKGMWHKPSNLFILSYFIVSFQYLIDFVLGYKTYSNFYIGSSVNKMAVTCLLGLISYILGYIIFTPRHIKTATNKINADVSTHFLVILQVVFFVGWVVTVNIILLLSGQRYFDDMAGSLTSNFESLFYDVTVAILVSIILKCKTKSISTLKGFIREMPIVSLILILTYCLVRLVSGDRGPCIYMALSVFYAFIAVTHKSIKLTKILMFVVVGAFILNIVGIARTLSLDMSFSERVNTAINEFSFGESEARFSDKTVLSFTEELAMSNRCNQISINIIDNGVDSYHNGMYAFYQLIQCIPFVPSFLHNTLKIPDNQLSANIQMTDVYYGRHDLAQIGTTVVADSYFDFGVIGVIMMLMLCGWVFSKVDFRICISTPNSWFQMIIILLFASMAVYIPRSTLIIQLQQLIPICVFYYINLLFFCKR